jgi:hypothetical protein
VFGVGVTTAVPVVLAVPPWISIVGAWIWELPVAVKAPTELELMRMVQAVVTVDVPLVLRAPEPVDANT